MTECSLLKISLQTSVWLPVCTKLHCPSKGVTWGHPSMIQSHGLKLCCLCYPEPSTCLLKSSSEMNTMQTLHTGLLFRDISPMFVLHRDEWGISFYQENIWFVFCFALIPAVVSGLLYHCDLQLNCLTSLVRTVLTYNYCVKVLLKLPFLSWKIIEHAVVFRHSYAWITVLM